MIYCKLKGGLGNILFQIAATYHMSILKNTECYFVNFSSLLKEVNQYYKNEKTEEYRTFLPINEGYPTQQLKMYCYPFHYENYLPAENSFIIDGFFQSEKYFLDSRNKILNLFSPSKEIEKIIKDKYSHLLEKETIALHVRRGDYLKFPDHHPVQNIEYYKNGISFIKEKKEIENILVFSDDIEWCKKNLQFENFIFIENEKDYIELFLMSRCSNNIISNSSFSWWGAWLNNSAEKVVVAPKKWFEKKINHKTTDIIPENWIIL